MNESTEQRVDEALADANYVVSGHLMRTVREQGGLTQRVMAELIGVSQPTYANWERGVHRPSLIHRKALREVLATVRIRLDQLDV